MISLTSEVLPGRRIRDGKREAAGDQGLLEREIHSSVLEMIFVEPMILRKSSWA